MSAFQAVNTSLAPEPPSHQGEEATATTPRPTIGLSAPPASSAKLDDAKTPTRTSFGALSSQRPLPDPISAPDAPEDKKAIKRGNSRYSAKSRDSEDVDMDDSDNDDEDGSDEESVAADGTRTTKKKKSQRFFCTDYPPCSLSFTRSEHLARHIRKHTGERPFQCHCSRRFSRLDNLRQHAQTVHVNEEIPGDSLAATGTRFQRQIRTDRVRPAGNRARASTGSLSGQPRGHTRNSLSASSINSIGSMYGNREDIRRRPPPLVMAADPRARLSHESYPSTESQYPSSSGFSTPISSRFSGGYDSPQWSSAMGSPLSHSRTASIYAGHRTSGRRLSVPSSESPFQSPHGGFGPSSFGRSSLAPLNSGTRETFTPSGSMLASPTSSVGSAWSRRESLSSAADDYRRRTWHYPESQGGFTSRLQSVMTSGYYQPGPSQPGSSSSPAQITLPGIESFDPVPRPATPPRRNPSPMMIDTPSRAPMHPTEYSRPEERQSTIQWETNLPRNFTRLEIAQTTNRTDDASAWASDVTRAVQERAQQAQAELQRAAPRPSFGAPIYPSQEAHSRHAHHISAPPLTPRESKRQGWYAGPPIQCQRTSPEGSSSSENGVPGTPNSVANPDYHPLIVQPGGWEDSRPRLERGPGPAFSMIEQAISVYESGGALPPRPPREETKTDNSMLRLEALVAVATGERENAAAAAY